MEMTLNLVWAGLSLASAVAGLHYKEQADQHRWLPIVALGVIWVTLFPVISVSDDLWSIQNPAEADTCLRKNEPSATTHPLLTSPPALLPSTGCAIRVQTKPAL